MDMEHWATIVSAVIGIVGTALFFYNNTDIPFAGAFWGGPETHANDEKIASASLRTITEPLCD
jgi:hypothetical protein